MSYFFVPYRIRIELGVLATNVPHSLPTDSPAQQHIPTSRHVKFSEPLTAPEEQESPPRC
jgi:hypothetical protein